MSNQIVNNNDSALSILAEISGGSQPAVEMMIGIGLVKDSEAVFFQYLGDDRVPQALMMPSGKPVTRMEGVTLTGVSIAEGIGEFNSTKLNVFLATGNNRTLMLTSGLRTIWSQCVLTGLTELLLNGELDQPIVLDSWKGTSKMKPCFAAIRQAGAKLSSTSMYESLSAARSSRDDAKQEAILKDAVNNISAAFGVVPNDIVVEEVSQDADY